MGPWTAPEPLVDPRDSTGPSYAYGPGGIMFGPKCQGEHCAEFQDAWPTDEGALYAPDIIDPWTTLQPDGTTTLYWHVSTWNPYQVVLMRTNIAPR